MPIWCKLCMGLNEDPRKPWPSLQVAMQSTLKAGQPAPHKLRPKALNCASKSSAPGGGR